MFVEYYGQAYLAQNPTIRSEKGENERRKKYLEQENNHLHCHPRYEQPAGTSGTSGNKEEICQHRILECENSFSSWTLPSPFLLADLNLHDATFKSPERPHQWVCQLGGWYRGRCRTGRPAQGPGSPPTVTSSWFWPKALQKVSYLDQVGNIEAQGEEEKRGTNEPEQCSTMFTVHDFLKIRNKNMNRVWQL